MLPIWAQDPFYTSLPWLDSAAAPIIASERYHAYLDVSHLANILAEAQAEGSEDTVYLDLPHPDGSRERFQVFVSPIMEPELAARYPEIRTFMVRSAEGPSRGRVDFTPQGFHASISAPGSSWYIDPWIPGEPDRVISYDGPNQRRQGMHKACTQRGESSYIQAGEQTSIEGGLLTYRCAIACTGEYAEFHGGTTVSALGAIVTALNRVNEIYERDLGIRMMLVANNDAVIFLDSASDPYSNDDGVAMLGENQSTLNSIIGFTNYDIGHVFSTGGGGIAQLGAVCGPAKAAGVTGLANPIGDPFYVDYVAHEMGHQWGANHTFNGNDGFCAGNRNPSTAFEPGSGSSIMSYAGICGSQDLQSNSDAFFHGASFDQIVAFSRDGLGQSCAIPLVSVNTAPVVDAGADYTVPFQTPFQLEGSAVDAEEEDVSYAWEQFDLGPAGGPGIDDGLGPMVRAYFPSERPTRSIPGGNYALDGAVPFGEALPVTDRTLQFRLTARDGAPGGGGVAYDTMAVTVTTSAGPFRVTAPGTPLWGANQSRIVQWEVANTDMAPVNCPSVEIHLSVDGGQEFPHVLASNVPNTGEALVSVPALDTEQARIRVSGSDQIFFAINQNDVIITTLECTTTPDQWDSPVGSQFFDLNDNGKTDITEFIACTLP